MDAVMVSLARTLDLCLLYLAVMVGAILLSIGVFKFAAWIADRRKTPPSSNS